MIDGGNGDNDADGDNGSNPNLRGDWQKWGLTASSRNDPTGNSNI